MPDPAFRDRLHLHYLDLKKQHRDMEPGSAERFDAERAISATARLYATLYREGIEPLHNGPHPEQQNAPAATGR